MTAREHGWERVVAMGDVSIQRSQWLDAQCLELQLLVSGPQSAGLSGSSPHHGAHKICIWHVLAAAGSLESLGCDVVGHVLSWSTSCHELSTCGIMWFMLLTS